MTLSDPALSITKQHLAISFAAPEVAARQLMQHHSRTLTRHIEQSPADVDTFIHVQTQTQHGGIVEPALVVAFTSHGFHDEAILAWGGTMPNTCIAARAIRMFSGWELDVTVAVCQKGPRELIPQDLRYIGYLLGPEA